MRLHELPRVADQAPLVAGGEGVAVDEALGHSQHAELLGDGPLHLWSRPHGQLHAASADVHHHGSPALEIDAVERGQVDQPGLLLCRDDLRIEADLAPHALEEILAVGGLAHGGGGHDQELVDAVHVRQPLVLAQRIESPPHGGRGQPTPRQRALAEADHLLLAVDHVEPAGAALHDDHVKGVAADVDGGDPHLCSL